MAAARDRDHARLWPSARSPPTFLGALPVINPHVSVLPENDRGTCDSSILSGPHTILITLLGVIPVRFGEGRSVNLAASVCHVFAVCLPIVVGQPTGALDRPEYCAGTRWHPDPETASASTMPVVHDAGGPFAPAGSPQN